MTGWLTIRIMCTSGVICLSYTEDKVVLNFHGKRFFFLTPPYVRQATRPVTRQK